MSKTRDNWRKLAGYNSVDELHAPWDGKPILAKWAKDRPAKIAMVKFALYAPWHSCPRGFVFVGVQEDGTPVAHLRWPTHWQPL